jgi:uroporphyrinogen-III decarboxylase
LLPSLSKTGLDILDIDWMVDIAEAHRIMGPEVMICGNIDPVSVIMEGSKQLINEKYVETANKIPRENWIMMGGCEIPPATPVENMNYLRKLSR